MLGLGESMADHATPTLDAGMQMLQSLEASGDLDTPLSAESEVTYQYVNRRYLNANVVHTTKSRTLVIWAQKSHLGPNGTRYARCRLRAQKSLHFRPPPPPKCPLLWICPPQNQFVPPHINNRYGTLIVKKFGHSRHSIYLFSIFLERHTLIQYGIHPRVDLHRLLCLGK